MLIFSLNLELSLHLKCPPFTNPADFYIDKLGVDVNDIENSRDEIQVSILKVFFIWF